ncbi:putative membrane protein YfhO [Enterococcus sp. PF1-24]|uniref:YfhO family protein n=1 Tax=unclassified Enterococcus TaxID=2608891 RepID=UPI0024755A42|nr:MULTISPECIES: YfhO family protein [unclassified Enterococcus]MDH6363843.1 putative membrane protein YfhO [Enterococcus sp. PFB1-1]MDH6400971.1 putative membrane protein YfhO [Enterococcus sp. PF1-24]
MKLKNFFSIKKADWPMLASFLIPLLVMIIVYLLTGIYPGSSRSILASDAFSQFSNFYASFRNVLSGQQNIFYTWTAALGLNYLALVSYYLGGAFTFLVFLFPNQWMPDALYFITIIKIALAGLAFYHLAKRTFKIPPWQQTALSVAYALMSFATAHSELIMWSDAFIYLPLVILGINQVLAKKRPTLLFISYLLLFTSNFYMGFMVAIFSGLYYLARLFSNWKKHRHSIFRYSLTALLATGASMVIILPTVLDLRNNGETLSDVSTLKTAATNVWDIIMKNMIGVYDTTKYGSIPFIYVGLLPFVLCLFYFVTKKIAWRNKLAFASLFAILIASFYLNPLNLFWHGMHAPNMFLFRYAYLFSFLVVLLAGYALEVVNVLKAFSLRPFILLVAAIFCIVYGVAKNQYPYVSLFSFILTIAFLLLYFATFSLYQIKVLSLKKMTALLLLFMTAEAFINTNSMIQGILDDWNYASRSLFTEPYPDIKQLVTTAQQEEDEFFRLENLNPVSSNDSLNYGYNGLSFFSSIRNRNSSSYLNQLGFRSRGTNLNMRYANNTLLMDSFFGFKYNISQDDISKYGFNKIDSANTYNLYQNQAALPLAFLTSEHIYQLAELPNDNLGTQTDLINTVAGLDLNYYTFYEPYIIETNNTEVIETVANVTYKELEGNIAKDISWEVVVPAHTQAYISLFPTDFGELKSSTATVSVNGESQKSQINITGQYYNLGYYAEQTTVEFTVSFYGTPSITLLKPKVLALDTVAYQAAMDAINSQGLTIAENPGRKVTTTVETPQKQVLLTTIPYDQGWQAYVDGKKVEIVPFEDAFLSIPIPAGRHQVEFKFLPQGFKIGLCLFIICNAIFWLYCWHLKQQMLKQRQRQRARKRKLNH